MHRPIVLALLVLVVLSGPIAADGNRGFYVSAKLGTTDVDADLDTNFDQVINGDEDSTTLEAGYQFSRFWAVQAAYHDFGQLDAAGSCAVCNQVVGLTADTKAYSAAIVPQIDLLARLSVFGKVGIVIWETQLEATREDSAAFIDDFTNEDILYGAGARFQLLGPLSVFAEWERIASEIETISFGATIKF